MSRRGLNAREQGSPWCPYQAFCMPSTISEAPKDIMGATNGVAAPSVATMATIPTATDRPPRTIWAHPLSSRSRAARASSSSQRSRMRPAMPSKDAAAASARPAE